MKKCITGLALLSAFSIFGDISILCLDSDFSSEKYLMHIHEGQNFELSFLRIGGVDYLDAESNDIECQTANDSVEGIEERREITCNLPNDLWASIHYARDGVGTANGSASVFSSYDNSQVDQYSEFDCMVSTRL